MAGTGASGPDGLAVIDKERGWTSHDVVAKARGLLGTRKVGHSGTLDPDATGVLLLGVGRVTRLLRFLGALRKRYTGVVVLGSATSTLDDSGDVIGSWEMSAIGRAEVQRAAAMFLGDITQVPPMVSAVQIGGRRLHELARQGIEVERDGAGLSPSTTCALVKRASRAASRSKSSARQVPTSVSSPPIWGRRSVAAPTCATCDARPSVRSRWPTRLRSARSRRSAC